MVDFFGIDRFWGPFLEGPAEKFSHPESRSKISNLMITELFYSYILDMNKGSLHTKSSRYIVSVFRYRLTKTVFAGPKSFQGFRETGPWLVGLVGFSCSVSWRTTVFGLV